MLMPGWNQLIVLSPRPKNPLERYSAIEECRVGIHEAFGLLPSVVLGITRLISPLGMAANK
jgi:hypothetical protein